MTDADCERQGGLGAALKKMIAADNDRYYRLFDQLRAVAKDAIIKRPNLSKYHHMPEFEICEGPSEVTLSSKDFGGRGCIVYDVGALFDREDPAEPSDEAWRAIVQVVLSACGVAEAGAIHPEPLNTWTTCSKKTLNALRTWTFIRSTGRHPPEGNKPGKKASDTEREWAAKPFADF